MDGKHFHRPPLPKKRYIFTALTLQIVNKPASKEVYGMVCRSRNSYRVNTE